MQVLLEGKQVQEQASKEVLLQIIADKYSRAILEATMYSPKSVIELCANFQIPRTSAYRKIQDLQSNKLLDRLIAINDDGNKHFLYKSNIKSIIACFKENLLEIAIVPNS